MPFIVTPAMLISAQGLAERISGRRSQIVGDPVIAGTANTRLLGIPLLVYRFAAQRPDGLAPALGRPPPRLGLRLHRAR